MLDINISLEKDSLLYDIQNESKILDDKMFYLDKAEYSLEKMNDFITSNKNLISVESVSDGDINIAFANFNGFIDDIGYDGKAITTYDVSKESLKTLVVAQEGILEDIWKLIKGLLKSIYDSISKMYRSISKFFGLEKSKLEEDETELDKLADLQDFTVVKSSVESLLKKHKNIFKVFLSLGKDILSKDDFVKYSDVVIGNKTLLDDKKLLVEGLKTPAPKLITVNREFLKLGPVATTNLYTNAHGLVNKSHGKEVNGHLLVNFGTKEAGLITMLKVKDKKFVEIIHSTLTISDNVIDKKINKNVSKLNKKYLYGIIEIRKNILSEDKTFSDNAAKFEKEIEKAYEEISSDKDSKDSLVKNTKAIGNILSNTAKVLVDHNDAFDKLYNDVLGIYKKAIKEAE